MTGQLGNARARVLVVVSTGALAAADFVNINRMTRVGDHFIASLNGHLDEALAVARNPRDAVYPVGTCSSSF